MPRERARGRRGWLAILCLLAWVPACGAILGIDDGILEDSGSEHDAGGTADHDAAADGGHARDSSKGGVDASTPPPPTDGGAIVYVSADGSASTPCGTRSEPCLTVHDGVATATALVTPKRSATVWIGEGDYAESVVLASGVSIRGGFTPDWTVAVGGPGTVITGAGSATLTAKSLKGQITVSTVTLKSTASPDPGESVYGVFATSEADAGAPLTLEDVVIKLGPAGAGAVGTKGAGGPPAGASCLTSGNPYLGAGGADAPNAGTFSIDGFTPSDGATGSPGGPGLTGAPGKAGCAMPCIGGCASDSCNAAPSNEVCAAPGPGGCGGGGGAGGTGGAGGGSSIALFVWNVPVIVKGGALGAGDGGDGAKGGPGGNGGPGGTGPKPATASCPSACAIQDLVLCENTEFSTATSADGAPGGTGGLGGGGGDGAGGSSYSLYAGGSSSPIVSGVVAYSQGKAGAGSPLGISAQQGSSSE